MFENLLGHRISDAYQLYSSGVFHPSAFESPVFGNCPQVSQRIGLTLVPVKFCFNSQPARRVGMESTAQGGAVLGARVTTRLPGPLPTVTR